MRTAADSVNEESTQNSSKETSFLFISNLILAARIKKIALQNIELRKKTVFAEVI